MVPRNLDTARKLYHTMDLNAHDANTRAYQAEQRAHEAADRVGTKEKELTALARELAQAQIDLRAAVEERHSVGHWADEVLRVTQR